MDRIDAVSAITGPSVASRVYFGVGVAYVVFGGLVAAVTGPFQWERGSWAAAYIVLICGVALCVIGKAHEYLATSALSPRTEWSVFVAWNAANAAVLTGSLLETPLLVDLGAVVLIGTVLASAWFVRGSRRVALSWAYRLVALTIVVSAPIGSLLAHT